MGMCSFNAIAACDRDSADPALNSSPECRHAIFAHFDVCYVKVADVSQRAALQAGWLS